MAQRGKLAFTDPEELEQRIEEYFESRWSTRTITAKDGTTWEEPYMRPPTLAGLALALDTTRQTLLAYSRGDGSRDDRFVPIIARAKMRIAEFAEEALYVREASNGAKFALEVNHGYGREDLSDGDAEVFRSETIAPRAIEDRTQAVPRWEPQTEEHEDGSS